MEKLDIEKMDLWELKRRFAGLWKTYKKVWPILKKQVVDLFDYYIQRRYKLKLEKQWLYYYLKISNQRLRKIATIYNWTYFNLFSCIYWKLDIDNRDAIKLLHNNINRNSIWLYDLSIDSMDAVDLLNDNYEIEYYQRYMKNLKQWFQYYLVSPYMVHCMIHNEKVVKILFDLD